ncbi:pilus assembly protein Flp/PilA [Enterovirga rhinocerotis]|uniref:Pilus assembly protein Flp/PilA n=2 Tax=Enterovirga rhinocerotis TaxID=1339210 RepID=A0A4R7C5R1_9HYPH|nr:pilus assembly protein Flp/PilA [Enterovirga rhinocerotis]
MAGSCMFKRWRHDAGGATAIEYALIAGLISIAIVGGLNMMATGTGSLYGTIETAFKTHLSGS